jgi:DNA-binding NtrC family response regulator
MSADPIKAHHIAERILYCKASPGSPQWRSFVETEIRLAFEVAMTKMAVPAMPKGSGEQLMGMPLREARAVFEREYLRAQISRFGGNIRRTAEFVGMERSALHRKLTALDARPSGIEG